MAAYYNEIDPQAAEWIRELIKAGLVAPGEVDERDVQDVQPSDLKGFTQVHAFAGIGVWSYALRLAGWPDERPVWTGSCPCTPFSAAGKGAGFTDERHLWPAFYHLISECRPGVCFGEQVSSKGGLAWLNLVQDDLEGAGYAIGAVDLSASSFGAPHIRQRLYWVADSAERGVGSLDRESRPGVQSPEQDRGRGIPRILADTGFHGDDGRSEQSESNGAGVRLASHCSGDDLLADPGSQRRDGEPVRVQPREPRCGGVETTGSGAVDLMADTDAERSERRSAPTRREAGTRAGAPGGVPARLLALTGYEPAGRGLCRPGEGTGANGSGASGQPERISNGDLAHEHVAPGPTNGFWAGADWIYCRDGKYRPVKSGITALVTKSSNRVVKLRGLGNSIVAVQAQGFIEAYLEARGER